MKLYVLGHTRGQRRSYNITCWWQCLWMRSKLPKETFINLSNFPVEFILSQTAGLVFGLSAPWTAAKSLHLVYKNLKSQIIFAEIINVPARYFPTDPHGSMKSIKEGRPYIQFLTSWSAQSLHEGLTSHFTVWWRYIMTHYYSLSISSQQQKNPKKPLKTNPPFGIRDAKQGYWKKGCCRPWKRTNKSINPFHSKQGLWFE